jgi:HPt (histidine-containing phosphotransfer) domain-containing protein
MGIFNKKLSVATQSFTVPITLKAESEQQAAEAAKTLAGIATFFNAKELAAVQNALNNPAIRAIIKSKL